MKEVGGWVSTVENFTSAPMGDSFKVIVQVGVACQAKPDVLPVLEGAGCGDESLS